MNKEQRDAVPSITVQADLALERVLTLELVRVTERAAVSAARLSGRGNEKAADQAAVDAMRRELNAPDVYMEKIAIGPGYAVGVVDLDAPAEENIRRLAQAKGVQPSDITALI